MATDVGEENDAIENLKKTAKLKQKRFAILMAYCGLGYHGIQVGEKK